MINFAEIIIQMKSILTLVLLFGAGLLYAQDIDWKKGVITMDDQPFLESSCKSALTAYPCTYTYTGKPGVSFSINQFSYITVQKQYVNRSWVMVDAEAKYYKITFIDPNVEIFSRLMPKALLKHIWKMKVFESDGTINKTNLDMFAKSYGESESSILANAKPAQNNIIINNNYGGSNTINR